MFNTVSKEPTSTHATPSRNCHTITFPPRPNTRRAVHEMLHFLANYSTDLHDVSNARGNCAQHSLFFSSFFLTLTHFCSNPCASSLKWQSTCTAAFSRHVQPLAPYKAGHAYPKPKHSHLTQQPKGANLL